MDTIIIIFCSFVFKQKSNLPASAVDKDIVVTVRNQIRDENQGFDVARMLHFSSAFWVLTLASPFAYSLPQLAEEVRGYLIFQPVSQF